MKFPRLSLIALAVVAVLVGAVWYSKTHPGKLFGQPVAIDSTTVDHAFAETPSDVPWDLTHWIDASLSESGIWAYRDSFLAADPTQRTRLSKDSTGAVPVWTVDFSNLPVSALGYGSEEDWSDFDVKVHLRGSRICGEAKQAVSKWIRHRSTGLDDGNCSPAADLALVRSWFQENFHRAPSNTEITGPTGARPTALRLRCSSGDSLHDLARMRSASPDTLEIDGCLIGSTEQLGMRHIAAKRFVFRDLQEELLKFDEFTQAKEIVVEGGKAMSILLPKACPTDNPDCKWREQRLKPGLSVKVSRIPLCDPNLVEELTRDGVVLENTSCADYPNELAALRKRIAADWDILVGQDLSPHLKETYDSLVPDSLPRFSTTDTVYRDAVQWTSWNQCGDQSYPDGFNSIYTEYGKEWIDGFGETFFTGTAIETSSGKRLRSGMTRQESAKALGRPSLDEGDFQAWGVHGECSDSPAGIRAHFDSEGKLDAITVDYGHDCDDC